MFCGFFLFAAFDDFKTIWDQQTLGKCIEAKTGALVSGRGGRSAR